MKAAVYNRFWHTAGGGEQFAGVIAELLATRHDVSLVAHEPVDTALLRERLGLELDHIPQLVLEGASARAFAKATEKFDLLVNCSYMTTMPSGAVRSILVVHFPEQFDRDLSALQRGAIRAVGPLVRPRGARVEWGTGFHHPEQEGRRRWRWTTGRAVVHAIVDEPNVPLTLTFTTAYCPAGHDPHVSITVGGQVVLDRRVGVPETVTVSTELGALSDAPIDVVIESDTFVPAALFGGHDWREMGVMVLGLDVGRRRPLNAARARVPWLERELTSLAFLGTYDRVASNSEYTARWVRRYWKVPTSVLYPPVAMRSSGDKRPLILSVGRFFGRGAGHSKKQMEMVHAFRDLVAAGAREWRLALVGGTSSDHLDYLEQVRHAASGLPIDIHPNAGAGTLERLYREAAVYWHATGLGEHPRRHPERFEHFGISTVEAMSAGAVPVVFDGGGLRELVTDGVHGYLFDSAATLVARTRLLMEDDGLRGRMSEAASARGRDFAHEAFASRLWKLVDDTVDTG